ncbi:MAG: flagellar basal body rod protein FlgC [Pseudomonadota bacterium]
MNDLLQSLEITASAMKAQSTRLRYISENIANADTPGFRRKLTTFQAVRDGIDPTGEIQSGPVRLDDRELPRVFDPSHPMADDTGYYDGSNVEMLIEISDARQAQRSYEANVKMFDQARRMTSSLLDLLRR